MQIPILFCIFDSPSLILIFSRITLMHINFSFLYALSITVIALLKTMYRIWMWCCMALNSSAAS